jgi:hypothetical protein
MKNNSCCRFWFVLFYVWMVLTTFAFGASTDSNVPEQQVQIGLQAQDSNGISLPASIKKDLYKWPGRLLDDSKDTFLRVDNAAALLLAGGASIVMNQDADDEIAEYYKKHHSFDNLKDEGLKVAGNPATHIIAGAIWYLLRSKDKDDFSRERALTLNTALTINWMAYTILKTARNNDTPNGKNRAWPSGHTSSSFAFASVLDEFYGPKIGIPAYILAGFVGYRMIDTGDHWASDVVFGATLGWVVGHTVAGKHKDPEIAGFKILLYLPAGQESAFGIGLVKRF